MADRLEAVKASNPCPICGHPDWCYFTYGDYADYKRQDGWDNDAVFIHCRRAERYVCVSDVGSRGGAMETVDTPRGAFVNLGRYTDKQGVPYTRFQDLASYQRKEAFWAERKKKNGSDSSRVRVIKRSAPVPPPVKEPEVVIAPPARLHEVYAAYLGMLPLEDWTVRELMEHDKWSEEMVRTLCNAYMIRSMPPEDSERFGKDRPRYNEIRALNLKAPSRKKLVEQLIAQVGEPLGVPGFQLTIKDDGSRVWRFKAMEGYIIPVFDCCGYIVRLRIRCTGSVLRQLAVDELEAMPEKNPSKYKELMEQFYGEEEAVVKYLTKKQGKYKWASARADKGGVPSGTATGFYGLNLLPAYHKGQIKRAFITEGEKKGMVTSYLWGYLFVTLPGVGQYHMLATEVIPSAGMTAYDWFKANGITTICVAFDADMRSNPMVLSAAEGACREAYSHGFRVEIVSWSVIGGKGCDDAAICGELPVLTPLYFD